MALAVLVAGIAYADQNYDPFRVAKRRWTAPDRYLYEVVDPKLLAIDPADLINREVVRTPEVVRARLAALVWGTDGYPTNLRPAKVETGIKDDFLGPLPENVLVDRLRFDLGLGLTSTLYYVRPAHRNNRLVLYHHGFGESIAHAGPFLNALLNAGYDVLAINALGHGGNPVMAKANQPGVVPYERNTGYSNVFHHPTHFVRPLQYHLNPIIGGMRYALTQHDYDSVDMVGLSIGGFFTILAAAVEPRIERSYTVAADYPIYLRRGQENFNGAIPEYKPLLRTANHLDLYVLGATGHGRSQIQIFHRYDRCCYNGLRGRVYEKAVKDAVAATPDGGRFQVFIDGSHVDHRIREFSIKTILADLARGR